MKLLRIRALFSHSVERSDDLKRPIACDVKRYEKSVIEVYATARSCGLSFGRISTLNCCFCLCRSSRLYTRCIF